MNDHQDNGARPASELTKRERMAMEMAKLMLVDVGYPPDMEGFAQDNARQAVECADALLAELAKRKDGAK